ncbi:MAG: iron-sulfur cluster assembly accessory protein [Imperialibacter sp.]|uniref:HesB/IscA family protein n=1 Tax=Imperialibacter sp. TaxID=2038411 RepID=UPI0032EC946D
MNIHPVSISEKALGEIKEIIAKKKIPEGYGLRIGIRGAGCAGVSYMLGFDKKKEGDIEYSIAGISVFIEKRHTMYLIGLEVDFYDGADARGFSFVNPDLPVPDQAH